jgi:CHAT domain-containing protein
MLQFRRAGHSFAALAEAQKLEAAIIQQGGHAHHSAFLPLIAQQFKVHGRYVRAEELYKRLLALHENELEEALTTTPRSTAEGHRLYGKKAGARVGIMMALRELASLYRLQGRYQDAARLYERALAVGNERHDSVVKVDLTDYSLRGLIHESAGRYEEAAADYQRVLKKENVVSAERMHLPPVPDPFVLERLANVLRIQGKYAEAERAFEKSLAIREKLALSWDLTTPLLGLAKVKQLRRAYSDAEALYQRALSTNETEFGVNHPENALILNGLAGLHGASGNVAQALAYSRRTTAVTIAHAGLEAEAAVARESQWSRLVEQRSELFKLHLAHLSAAARNGIEQATALGHEAVEIAQWAGHSAAAAAVQQTAARFASGNGALAALVRESQDLGASWREKQKHLITALSKRGGTGRTEIDGLRRDIADIERRLVAIATELEKQYPGYTALVRPTPLNAKEAQKLLDVDEALVFWVTGEHEAYLFALTRDGFDWQPIPIGERELSQKIVALRRGLDVAAISASGKPNLFDLGVAHELYAVLLRPIEHVIREKRNLAVVPSGSLTALPFHLLVTDKPPRAVPEALSGYRDAAFLLKRHTVSVLPSVASLKALRMPGGKSGPKPMVGFGDPIFGSDEGQQLRATAQDNPAKNTALTVRRPSYADFWKGADVDRENLAKALPRLEDTAEELKAIAKRLGASTTDIHLRAAASETTVKGADLGSYRIVYFATHGLVAGDVRGLGEPSLALTLPKQPTDFDDGLLTASEVAQLKLNADWVVLSACNTIAGDRPGAEALSGLARAFFYAGARALLVSHWAVDSAAATRLTTETFDKLQKDPSISRAEALRQAMLDYLNDASGPNNAYPAYWAPFVLVGEGAVR